MFIIIYNLKLLKKEGTIAVSPLNIIIDADDPFIEMIGSYLHNELLHLEQTHQSFSLELITKDPN